MMTKRLEIYKCKICGNIVEVIHQGAGQLVCCGTQFDPGIVQAFIATFRRPNSNCLCTAYTDPYVRNGQEQDDIRSK
jgi:desulfoferrodoxin-like iron-binding protein